jgi:ClpP class serine protease
MNISDLIWLFLLFAFLTPAITQRLQNIQRLSLIRKIEEKRKTRVISLIHRQETIAILGIPFTRFIDIEDSESILRAIRMTPGSVPIDVIIHTPGGLVLAADQIAKALVKHPSPVTIFVPHYAMSGGTLIALSGDRIVMDKNAVIGPLDPQVGEYPANSIIAVRNEKPIKEIEDKTLIYADIGKKAIEQICESIVYVLIHNKMEGKKAEELANLLTSGKWTHDYPIEFEEAKTLGFPVSTGIPQEIYELMELYPQSSGRTPSVEYVPLPYRKAPKTSSS